MRLDRCPECGGASACSGLEAVECGVCLQYPPRAFDDVEMRFFAEGDLLYAEVAHYTDEQLSALALKGSQRAMELLAGRWGDAC